MPDTFSIKLVASVDEHTKGWEAARIVASTIEHVLPEGRARSKQPWELSYDGRRWMRATAKELEVLAAGLEIKGFAVYWTYGDPGLQWALTVYFWDDGRVSIEAGAFAGTDRMATEEAVRLVAKRAAERGVHVEQLETKISSTEGPAEPVTAHAVVNHRPMRKWAMFRAWVGPHLATYIVGVLTTLTTAGLLILLGLEG